MTLRVSTRFKERILGSESFESIFNGGRILVYSGTQPTSADYPPNGTLLATCTRFGLTWAPGGSSGGLQFTRSGMWVNKQTGDDWLVTASVAGTAGWFRLVAKETDAGGLSYSHARIDGAIGSDAVFADTTLSVGQTFYWQSFIYTIAPLGA